MPRTDDGRGSGAGKCITQLAGKTIAQGNERPYCCPACVRAHSSDENFHAFLRYGNHKTVLEDPAKTKDAVAKDVCRGYSLAADTRLVYFMRDIHITPLGLVDLNTMYKNPRPIFDSTFRPYHGAMAINDWTTKATEPEIVFATSFQANLIWLYNLRVTYPDQEIYVGDDDVSGAFRHNKYHPSLVAMHAFILFGYLFFATGTTFGDCTSPSNWEVLARIRQLLAQHLWYQPTTLPQAKRFLPAITFATPPTPVDIASFTVCPPDSLNSGVLDEHGNRFAPRYPHHVDDNMYADVGCFMPNTVAASILALYLVLGYPSPTNRDAVSWEKFEASFTHERKHLGWWINSRTMTVALPPYKRERLLALLQVWLDQPSFTLREIATILGQLGSATLVNSHQSVLPSPLGGCLLALTWPSHMPNLV